MWTETLNYAKFLGQKNSIAIKKKTINREEKKINCLWRLVLCSDWMFCELLFCFVLNFESFWLYFLCDNASVYGWFSISVVNHPLLYYFLKFQVQTHWVFLIFLASCVLFCFKMLIFWCKFYQIKWDKNPKSKIKKVLETSEVILLHRHIFSLAGFSLNRMWSDWFKIAE